MESVSGAGPLVSIVMLAWNRRDDVMHGLGKIKEGSYRHLEIIVVDNGSTDGTAEVVRLRHPDIRLIALEKNRGIEGYNIGFKAAQGKYVVILDDDSFPARDAVRIAVERLESDESVGAIAGRIIDTDSGEEWNVFDFYEYGEGVSFPVPMFVGCGAAVRRDLLERSGYYDARYFLYVNDLELSAKVIQAGYHILFMKKVVFNHQIIKQNRSSKRQFYFSVRNRYWFFVKYSPCWIAPYKMVEHFIFSLGYAIFYPALSVTFLQSHLDALRGIGNYIRERSPLGWKKWKVVGRNILLRPIRRSWRRIFLHNHG